MLYQGFGGFGFKDTCHCSVRIVDVNSFSGPGVSGSLGARGAVGSSPRLDAIAPSSGGALMKGWVNICWAVKPGKWMPHNGWRQASYECIGEQQEAPQVLDEWVH